MRKAKPEIQISFSTPVEPEVREYVDKYPEDLLTLADVKEKYGTVVWCKFTGCQFNLEVDGLQRTTSTLLKNRNYTPINQQEHTWAGVCTKDEIGIKYDNKK